MPLRGVFNARQEIIRIDHNVGQKLSLSGRYLHDTIPTIEPGGLFTNLFLPGVSTTQTDSPGRSLVIRGTYSFSPTLYNESVWAWSRGGIFSHPIGLTATANSPDIKPTLVFPAEARWIGDKAKPWVRDQVWPDVPGRWLRDRAQDHGWKRLGVYGGDVSSMDVSVPPSRWPGAVR